MADYFPLLSRTIASLGNSTAEQRQVVYQRARVVVGTQLSAIDPPMAEGAIARELELFEQSVVKLENEMLSLESLKGNADEDLTKEHSTRRHISARLSDLMAKAAAARTAATQERLKADLPPLTDPALSGPAVKVDAVPVPFVDAPVKDQFIDHDGDAVDHPLVQSSVIEGDPLDALAAAHVLKQIEEQTSVVEVSESLLSVPEVEDTQPASLSQQLPRPPMAVELPSGLVADAVTGEVRGRAAVLPRDNFSLIPWLSQEFISEASKDPSIQNEPVQDVRVEDEPVQHELLEEEAATPQDLSSDTGHLEPILANFAGEDHQPPLLSDEPTAPEMPQAFMDVVLQTGVTSAFWHGWSPNVNHDTVEQSTQTDAEDDTALSSAPPHSGAEMDTEAAKAAFWGDAYQPKKDEDEGHTQDEATGMVDVLVEDAVPAGLLELSEAESRPRLLQKRRLDRAIVRKLVMVVVFASVTAAVGVTAWILRDQPSDFEQNAGLQRPDLSRKINDRLQSDNAPQTEAAKASTPSGQIIGQRAILLEEFPDGQAPPPPVVGQVSWSLETIRDVNGAGDVAVKAEVKGLSGSLAGLSLALKRNRDASFPASHLLEVTFVTPEASPNGRVRDIGLPEMRIDETIRGAALFGLPVPVTDNVFLVGLTNLPDRIEFNIDLLRSRKWMVVPIRFANGRRAALIIEKGLAGDRALLDAFQAWK